MAAAGRSEIVDTGSWRKCDEFVLQERRHGCIGMPDEGLRACVMMTDCLCIRAIMCGTE